MELYTEKSAQIKGINFRMKVYDDCIIFGTYDCYDSIAELTESGLLESFKNTARALTSTDNIMTNNYTSSKYDIVLNYNKEKEYNKFLKMNVETQRSKDAKFKVWKNVADYAMSCFDSFINEHK